jgi:uracil-DNA glycosylase
LHQKTRFVDSFIGFFGFVSHLGDGFSLSQARACLSSARGRVKSGMLDVDTPSHRQILEFYAQIGVDLTTGEEAFDRLAAPVAPPAMAERLPPPDAPARRLPASIAPAAPDDAIMSARALAQSAPDLARLEAILTKFDGCALKKTASRLVFADGAPSSDLMIIGEAPGRDEDEIGRPFVGRAGQLLDKMLAAIGLDRSQVYIANIVPWRPPGNRTPTPQEIAICLPFILRQIELAAPKMLLTMGAPATQTLLHQRDGILRVRGRWFDHPVGERRIPALATLHPAYLLRQPAQKSLVWRDMRALKARLLALQSP